MQNTSKIILGIDPGTVVMGYGLISVSENRVVMLDMGVLRLGSQPDTHHRLHLIYAKVKEIITLHRPDSFAIEAPFFGKNVQSMLKLGRAQGVAIAAAMEAGLDVCEYSPKRIKQSITGNGNAAKEQVMTMLEKILEFKNEHFPLDATDALAVALCHHYALCNPLNIPASKKGWQDFLKNNPHRVAGS